MSANKIIQAYAKKLLTKNRGSGIMELPSEMIADAKTGEILTILKQAGMPLTQIDDFIRSEKDLIKYLNIIQAATKPKVYSGQEAVDQLNKMFSKKGEVVKFPQKRSFAEEIEAMKKSGDLVDPNNLKKSQKVTDREMFKEANERFNKTDIVADSIARITSMEPFAALKEANKVIRREGIYKNLNKDQSQAILKGTDDWINQRDPSDLYDYNKNRPFRDDPDFDPDDPDYQDFLKNRDRDDYYTGGMVDVEPNLSDIGHGSDALMARTRLLSPGAQGTTSTGLNYLLAEDNDNIRIPFKTGTDQSKRAFLKLLGALGGGIATLKSGLLSFGGKGATKKLLSPIQTDNVAGKPEWFDALVTKVIKEGDDVTKNFAIKEREIVHKKKLNDNETVTVTQDLDEGSIRVDLDSPDNMLEDTVSLTYKKPKPDEGDPRPSAEFEVTESGFVGRANSPDDYFIDAEEVGGKTIKDLDSDVSVLKEYATGKKPTIKEMVQNMKRKDKVKKLNEGDLGAQSDYVISRQGDYYDYDDYASGGRAGFSSGKLVAQKLGITGSSRRFLEKVFGKEGFENIIRTDPAMYKGMLEVVEMFRKKDKEGLKMYLQKYLPHMDDEMIEDFIVGSGGSEGIKGQLIRLGSGRDYAGKLEMMKKADQMKKLSDLEVTDEMVRKPNALGGRIGFSGGGIFRAIISKAAAAKGMKPYEFIKVTSYKSLPPEVKMFMSPDDFAKLKAGQEQLYTNYIDMMKTRKNFQEQVEAGKKTPAGSIFEGMEKMMDEQSYVPKTVTADDIAEAELMVKNRFQKGRKDNAQGGIAKLLGE